MDHMQRQTKIVCTIGPATSSDGALRALIEAGMNVARLNFAHGDHVHHGEVIARIRALAERLDASVAVLQDLAGPKVRIGTVADGSIMLQAGHSLVLTTDPVEGSTTRVSVSYADLPREVEPGDGLLLADGSIQLRVERVTETEVHCRVVVGGRLSSRKGLNVPSGLSGLPVLSERDLHDLRFGLEQGVDYVGLSFVRSAADIHTARAHIDALDGQARVIAKIETQAALDHFDAIVDAADGIMIARGDLSIETPFTRVPIVQKRLIAKANQRAKPVITATQMLYSMVSAPQPTRAEVADVANAILDGSDAVMLSEETAVGEHPVRAVDIMAAIASETEGAILPDASLPRAMDTPLTEEEAVAQAACELATRLHSDVVVAISESGQTARFAAKCRGPHPILALTSDRGTYRRLALVRGVEPVLLSAPARDHAEPLEMVQRVIQERGWLGKRAVLVTAERVWRATL
jgi:pyruvate kinase